MNILTLKNKHLLALLIATGSILAYFLFFGSPVWGTNDDVGMSMISAGVWFAKKPSAHLMFIHPIYGSVISNLYKFIPGVPWYALAFLIIIGISLYSLNYAILNIPKFPIKFYGYFLLIFANLASVIPILFHLQFTVVAGLATLAGCILLLIFINQQPTRILTIISGVFLIIIGGMIREQSMFMVLLLLAPNALITIRNQKKFIWVSLIVAALILGLQQIYNYYYSFPGWQKWLQLNTLKAEFIDYQRIEYNQNTAKIFAEAGLTENDFKMIKSFQYIDEYYSPDKLKHIVVNAEKRSFVKNIRNIKLYIGTLIYATKISFLISIISFYLLIAILSMENNKKALVEVITIISSNILVYSYICFGLDRPAYRVVLVLFLTILWTFFVIFSKYHHSSHIKKNNKALVPFILLSLVLVSIYFHKVHEGIYNSRQNQTYLEKIIAEWKANLPPEAIIYNIGAYFRFEYHLPLKSFDYLASIKFISSGWLNQSPLQKEIIESFNLNPSAFYLSLANQQNVYIVTPLIKDNKDDFLLDVNTLAEFYREKYNIMLKLTPAPNLPYLSKMDFIKKN